MLFSTRRNFPRNNTFGLKTTENVAPRGKFRLAETSLKPGFHYTANATTTTQKKSD